MKRRLLDRFVLIDARFTHCDFELLDPTYSEPTNGTATISVKPRNEIRKSPPDGLIQACDTTLEIDLSVAKSGEADSVLYRLKIKIAGLWAMSVGAPASESELEKDGHCFTRMLFPLVRSEIARTLGRARMADLPLAWDMGARSNDPGASTD